MPEDNSKGDISRSNLERYDIYYHDGTRSDSIRPDPVSLPEHINAVRAGLLMMEDIIPGSWERHLREEHIQFNEINMGSTWTSQPPSSVFVQEERHYLDRQKHSEKWDFADLNLVCCHEIAKLARTHLRDPEAEWNSFWRKHVFCLFSDEASKQPRFDPMLDKWSLYGELTWNDFHNWVEPRVEEGVQDRTMPRPDLTYAFPVQNLLSSISRGFARDELLQTFSMQVLGKLIGLGISCTPTTALRQWVSAPSKTEMSNTDRSCFPWAVVEMKRKATKDKALIERCYCQAANGAAAALEMQEKLFDKLGHDAFSKPPPVVAFTCIGPIVKVWLAYQDERSLAQRPDKRMVCIWTTSVLLTWGVASLRAIIMNMHTWASRLLKPKLQACVYGVSEGLQKTDQSSSQTSSVRTLRHTPEYPDLSTTGGYPTLSAGESDPAARAPASFPRTPHRQQSSAAGSSQSDNPGQSALSESQRSRNAQSEPPNITTTSPHLSKCNIDTISLHDDLNPFSGSCTTRTPGLFGRATGGKPSQNLFSNHSGSNGGSSNSAASGVQNILLGKRLLRTNGVRSPSRAEKPQTIMSADNSTERSPLGPSKSAKDGLDVSSLQSEISAIVNRIFAQPPSNRDSSEISSVDDYNELGSNPRFQEDMTSAKTTTSSEEQNGTPVAPGLFGGGHPSNSNTFGLVDRNVTAKSDGLFGGDQSGNGNLFGSSDRNGTPTFSGLFGGGCLGSSSTVSLGDRHSTPTASGLVGSGHFGNGDRNVLSTPRGLFGGCGVGSSSPSGLFDRNVTPTPHGPSSRGGFGSSSTTMAASAGTHNLAPAPCNSGGGTRQTGQPTGFSPFTTLQPADRPVGTSSVDSGATFVSQQPTVGGASGISYAVQSSISISTSGSEYRQDSASESDSEDGLNLVGDTDSDATSVAENDWISEDDGYLSGASQESWVHPRDRM